MSTPAIDIQGIEKSFGLAFSLGPLSLTIPRGAIYALIGQNGAGKSTTLNMLMGVGRPSRGRIEVLDRDLDSCEVDIKRRTAYVSPDMDYRAWGTVGRAIDFVRGFYPDWNAARSEELQFKFGLHREERVDSLSFGARIKLNLVMALSRDPELLVLDEPTLGLDAIARRQLFTELLRFMKGAERTILISSHQLSDLERFADHAAIINQGRLLACGRMDALIERFHQIDVLVMDEVGISMGGVYVVEQQGDRARLLIDRASVPAGILESQPIRVIADVPLTLEDIFLTLVKSANARAAWRPRASAA